MASRGVYSRGDKGEGPFESYLPAPYPNVVIHVNYETTPISPSEEFRDYGGYPLSDARQHTNTEPNANLVLNST